MKLSISSSVGKNGKNLNKDVRLIQALLNVYARTVSSTPLVIDGISGSNLIAAITEFQTTHQKMPNPDGQVTSSRSSSFKALISVLDSTRTTRAVTNPTRGSLTWGAEGTEGGRYHSRILHVPSATSGVTIGRGYDMKYRSAAEITQHLISVGVTAERAAVIARSAGLSGNKATESIISNDLLDYEIGVDSQFKLFNLIYQDYVDTVKRICNKTKVVSLYGSVEWETLDKAIIDVLVDLTFRGDYHGSSRKVIQKSVADNDFTTFKSLIVNRENWPLWPQDRFNRRKAFLEQAARQRVAESRPAEIKPGAKHAQLQPSHLQQPHLQPSNLQQQAHAGAANPSAARVI